MMPITGHDLRLVLLLQSEHQTTSFNSSDSSFNAKPTKTLSDCGGRGLWSDPPSPTAVNLLSVYSHKQALLVSSYTKYTNHHSETWQKGVV